MKPEKQRAAQMLSRQKDLPSVLWPMVDREGSGHEVSQFIFKKGNQLEVGGW